MKFNKKIIELGDKLCALSDSFVEYVSDSDSISYRKIFLEFIEPIFYIVGEFAEPF